MNIHNIIHFVLFTFIFICTFFLFSSSPIKEANTNQDSVISMNSVSVEQSIIQPIANELQTLKENVNATNSMIESINNNEFINIYLREKNLEDRQSFIGIDQNEFKIVMEKMKDEEGNELPMRFKCILYLPTGNKGPKGPRGDKGPKGIVGPRGDIGPDGNTGTCNFH